MEDQLNVHELQKNDRGPPDRKITNRAPPGEDGSRDCVVIDPERLAKHGVRDAWMMKKWHTLLCR